MSTNSQALAERDIFLPEMATILENRPMTEHERFFRFQLPPNGRDTYFPGQFMELSVPGIGEAPISISSSPTRTAPGEFEMVVRRVGRVSGALHAMEPGEGFLKFSDAASHCQPLTVDDFTEGLLFGFTDHRIG